MSKEANGLKEALYEKYFGLGSNVDVPEIKRIQKEMESLRKQYGIKDKRFDFVIVLCELDVKVETSYDFKEQCDVVREIVKYLRENDDWEFLDLRIANCALLAIDDVETALFIYYKALKFVKEKASTWGNLDRFKYLLAINLSLSLLRIYYLNLYDKSLEEDLKREFFKCIDILMSADEDEICLPHAVARMRKALFNNDPDDAQEIVGELRKIVDNESIKKLQYEIDQYNYAINDEESMRIYRVHTSRAFAYFRKSLKITMNELSLTLKVSEGTISDIENQKVLIRSDILSRAVKVFKVTHEEFEEVGRGHEMEISEVEIVQASIHGLDKEQLSVVGMVIKAFKKLKKGDKK